MANREDGKSLFEDTLDAREGAERRTPTSVETKPLMGVAALLALMSAYFTANPDPFLHAGLIVAAFVCGGMTLTLRWDQRTGEADLNAGMSAERPGRLSPTSREQP